MPQTFADIAGAVQGRWVVEPAPGRVPPTGYSIDTRTLRPGDAFVAIAGENFDGHDFVTQAIDAGASLIIASNAEKLPPTPTPSLLVPDTVAALQQLAAAHRRQLKKVIAVAGSNGKTTTRHLIHHVLSATLTGTQSPRSFNNHLGVPLTLLAAAPEHDFTVVEIGTNHPGEIAQLAALVRPDITVVTSIGEEHLEFFHDLHGVAREEFSILAFTQQTALIPPEVQTEEYPLPAATCDVHRIDARDAVAAAVSFPGGLPGEHNRLNAAFAVGVARLFGLDDASIAQRLRTAEPVELRSVLRTVGRNDYAVTLMIDCYNANPSSMAAALTTLASLPAQRRVAILGDMFELGEQSARLHAQVGRLAATLKAAEDAPDENLPGELPGAGVDRAYVIGDQMSHFAAAFTTHRPAECLQHFPAYHDDLPARLAAQLRPGDAVLIKASRGMRLERLIPAIEQRFPA